MKRRSSVAGPCLGVRAPRDELARDVGGPGPIQRGVSVAVVGRCGCAALQELLEDRQVSHFGRDVERRVATRVAFVQVGALVEQQVEHRPLFLGLHVASYEHQWRLPLIVRGVHGGALCDQVFRQIHISRSCGVVQGFITILVARIQAQSLGEHHVDDFAGTGNMEQALALQPARGGVETAVEDDLERSHVRLLDQREGSRLLLRISPADVGAARHEEIGGVVASRYDRVERRMAVLVLLVRIGSGIEQPPDDGGVLRLVCAGLAQHGNGAGQLGLSFDQEGDDFLMSLQNGGLERRASNVHRVDVRPVVKQELDHVLLAETRRHVQGRVSGVALRVDVCAVRDEKSGDRQMSSFRVVILSPRRVMQRRPAAVVPLGLAHVHVRSRIDQLLHGIEVAALSGDEQRLCPGGRRSVAADRALGERQQTQRVARRQNERQNHCNGAPQIAEQAPVRVECATPH